MKMKVVYVLVSQETDYFLERLLLSLYSLRVYNPDIDVLILSDNDTKKRLNNSGLPDRVEILVVEIPDSFEQMQKSRYIKTCIRNVLKGGSFLYLDTDTIICNKLEDITYFNAGIAMVADGNGALPLSSSDFASINYCQKAGFGNMVGEPYFNGGVMYVSDSLESEDFFCKWHHRWRESVERGISLDQPALCCANRDSGYIIKEVSGIFNWQISKGVISDKENACIVHYYNCPFARRVIPEHIRRCGIDDTIKCVATASATQLYFLFTMPDIKLCEYLMSDMLSMYGDYPRYFNFVGRAAKMFLKPYVWLSKMKNLFKHR